MQNRSLVTALVTALVVVGVAGDNFTFTVAGDGSTLLRDGQSIRLISGSFHYFRCPAAEWDDRIRLMKAAGINALQTYIAWNFHCPSSSECDFTGDRNISHFFSTAHKHGLMVILRPGPYICAEWDLGGFPYWLLRHMPSEALRTSDPVYLQFVSGWWGTLLPIVRQHLYTVNGGPIVMVQVENEYGTYGSDAHYLTFLRDVLTAHLGTGVLLFSTDEAKLAAFKNSSIPGVFQAVDFFYLGTPESDQDVEMAWLIQHQTALLSNGTLLQGPNFNGEFYPGWMSHWLEPYVANHTVQYILNLSSQVLESPLSSNNLNFYMFFGGTNFAFWAGRLVTTSYDYGAPINESGHPSASFAPLQALFAKMNSTTTRNIEQPPPSPPPLQDLGWVTFTQSAELATNTRAIELVASSVSFVNCSTNATNVSDTFVCAPSLEELNQSNGFVMYSFSVSQNITSVTVSSTGYAAIYLDTQYIGFVFDGVNDTVYLSSGVYAESVWILFETVGRTNFWSPGTDLRVGLKHAAVTVQSSPTPLNPQSYLVYTIPMDYKTQLQRVPWQNTPHLSSVVQGSFLRGVFNLSISDPAQQGGTLLDMRRFGKGFVVVNGSPLGRYWSTAGPQRSLFCPRSYLNFNGENELIVFEQQSSSIPSGIELSNINWNR